MKPSVILLLLLGMTTSSFARPVRSLDIRTLIKQSEMVFVGSVKSVKPSGITTQLTYPTWDGQLFEWLEVEVEVVEAIKGVKSGEVVRVLMLSIREPREHRLMIDPPGMVDPKVGQHHLLCLLPTVLKNVYASVTAPLDDDRAIFLLDRKSWVEGATYWKDGKVVAFHEQSEKNRLLWSIVNDKGEIVSDAVEEVRRTFQTEIATPARHDAVIHLKWKKHASAGGWQWDVHDRGEENGDKGRKPDGASSKR